MSKVYISIYIFLLLSGALFSQPYGNEWLNNDQNYYKFPISNEGVYRIPSSTLTDAGINIGSFDPQNIQIFRNGQEIPIYIEGESIGIIEFIEFYAFGNDGSFDAKMYRNAEEQYNPYYSLINDTAYYFLTWNNSFNNQRITQSNDTDFTGLSTQQYYLKDTMILYTDEFLQGNTDCEYTTGEGYYDNNSLSVGNSITKTYSFNNVYSNGPSSAIEFLIAGFSDNTHHLQAEFNSIDLIDTTYFGRNSITYSTSFNSSNLVEDNEFTITSIDDFPDQANTDYSALGYFKIRYPCDNDLNNRLQFTFSVEEFADARIFDFLNLGNFGNTPYLMEVNQGIRYTTVFEAPSTKAKVSNPTVNNKFIVYAENSINEITEIKNVTLNTYTNSYPFIIISHPRIWESAQEYASYRNALLVNVEDLYNQFGFGIRKHPLAIRNFIEYIIDTWEISPDGLLFLGKGINAIDTRTNPTNFENCLIPPMGNPPSDMLLASNINNTLYEPIIPIGRVSAQTNDDVDFYLSKVKEFESQEAAEWMKQHIHFGGGLVASEQRTFAQYLEVYEDIIEDTLMGGIVTTFLKNSSDPIQITQSDSVKKLINGGVSLMTFFGHAYTGGFDQSIDDPSSFDNYGKYPFLLANSCYSGNIHLPGKASTSEDWVLIQSKGTIAFLSVVFEGYSTILHNYSTEFYKNISYKNYGESLGENIRQSTIAYQATSPNNQLIKNMCLEFTLHGDPLIVLNSFEKPDLTIGNASVFFDPQEITTAIDSFSVNVVNTNIGKAVRDTFLVQINRKFPNGSESIINKELYSSLYKDTISFKFPVDIFNGAGNNTLDIYIDQTNNIDELSETNNHKQVNLFIRSSNLVPVFPYDLGIVSESTISLKAATGDPFAEEASYIFEFDTTKEFNSSFRLENTITQVGGVLEWDLPIVLEENIVYWWRVSKIPADDEEYFWTTNSFTYSPGNHGWGMIDFDQMQQNSFSFIEQNEQTESYSFINTPKLLRCHNIGSPTIGQTSDIEYDIDGNKDWGLCGGVTSMVVVVIDSLTLIPWESNRADYGHYDYPKCFSRPRPDKYFIFTVDETGLNSFINFVNNEIPTGSHVLIYSYSRITYSNWPENVFEVFENLGSANIRSVPNNHPFIFYAQKGNPGSMEEITGSADDAIIDLEVEIKSNFYYGTIESSVIGPSNNWKSIQIDVDESTFLNNDSIHIKVLGLNNAFEEQVLFDQIQTDTTIQNLEDQISVEQYPYLKLSFFTYDEQLKTPVQLNSWNAFYDCSGELALNQQKGYYFYNDTLQQGDSLLFSTAIENVSPFDMDSLVIKYWIQDNYNETLSSVLKKIDSVKSNQVINDTVKFSTLNLSSENSVWVEINPINVNTGTYYQKEALHFNNITNRSFIIKRDERNPILDVTFDGYHIIDGEIISAEPEILIQTIDENEYLAVDDTSYFNIYLKSYETGIEKRISFASATEDITFIPAELPDNKCSILYNPVFTEDGKYALRVQSIDASNNESGDNDYEITFEIITASTITSIVNYPNPFSTSTQFVFTLTGSEVPDDLKIQIFTISGKFVKEIDLSNEEDIRIGKNITSYTWNGTDMYGDKLANGVYLYRVFSRIDGQNIEQRGTQADTYFKNSIGKMVILR